VRRFDKKAQTWMLAIAGMLMDPDIQRAFAFGIVMGDAERRLRPLTKRRR